MNEPKSFRKYKWLLFLMGLVKVPMIGYVKPKLLVLNDLTCQVKIRLRRRTKNHLNSMYFGALMVGADVAGGIHAFYFSDKYGGKVSFAFKDVKANFLKRAESEVLFTSNDGPIVEQAIQESKKTGERINSLVKIVATNTDNEVVSEIEMTVSVKVK